MNGTDCNELLSRLHAFLDGELDATSCTEVRVHLQECGPCMQNADFERAFKLLVARSCREDAPAGLLDRMKGLLD